ncbi:MAG: adenylate/guanylate cyclase domain-containing protein [Acidimicrobiales bacterium]
MREQAATGPVVLTVRQFARSPLHILLRDRITFGRDCDGFLLVDNRASRRHAEFRLVGSQVLVADLGSSNGTTRNGQAINGETLIEAGDIVGIGSAEIEVGEAVALATTTRQTVHSDLTTEMRTAERHRSSIARLSETVDTSELSALADDIGDEGTVTIVFSDIEDSTVRATSLGDASWMRALDLHNRILRAQLRRHGGREIKSQGDGFMMSFDSARRAVQFSIDAQRDVKQQRESEPSWDLTIRLGVHTGEAVRTADGDLYGRHVIIASRIADHAAGGEILVSSLVRELTRGKVDLRYDAGRTVELKGIGSQTVHLVSWTP